MQHDPDEEDQNAETLVEHSNSDVASESNESTSGSDDEIGSDEEDGEVEDEDPEDNSVDVTLEFFDPKEADFHGLKALLQSYLDGEAYSCSDLVDVIIKQSTVGTVVKSGDHGDPVGVLTALNTQRYKDAPCMRDIKAFILRHCTSESTKADLEKLWGRASTGLILSERLINCPPQLAPPLQQALFDEILWALEDEPTQVEELIVYTRPEDEFYHKHCTASYTFPTSRAAGKDELLALRLVMLLSSEQISAARRELDQAIGNAAAAEQS